jgi:arginine decarboxylase
MNIKYSDLIDQTYYFPQEEFSLEKDGLLFHNIPLNRLVEMYGSPLKFTYLPRISENINRAENWFVRAMKKHKYNADYFYC